MLRLCAFILFLMAAATLDLRAAPQTSPSNGRQSVSLVSIQIDKSVHSQLPATPLLPR